MLYKDFLKAGITMEELEFIQKTVETLGYELEEYLGTLAIINSEGIFKAIGLNAIINFLKGSDIKVFNLESNFLKDLYAKAA